MIGAPFSFYMALLGLLGGLVFGYVARRSGFCTLGAIEEAYYGTERSRLRSWVLAVGVAIAGTQALDLFGVIDLRESFYLAPTIRVVGSVVGGMMFGLGMAMVGTCAFGMLVRAGGGDMRSLVSILLLAIVGYATANGILAYVSTLVVMPTDIGLASAQSPALSDLWFGGGKAAQIFVGGVLSIGAIGWAVSSKRFLANRDAVISGLVIGGVIVYGWWITGTFGQSGFERVQFESYRFARPAGDTLVYLMTFSGAAITFPIGGVFGVMIGAFIAARQRGCFRFEAFDDSREMRRHFGGAALMGMGSILSLGCTIGQGMSGVSTLSINSFMTIGAIAISSWLGIRYLIEGEIPSLKDTVTRMLRR